MSDHNTLLQILTDRESLPTRFSLRDTDVVFRTFANEALVVAYDLRNGDTHLFGDLAYELCRLLTDSTATANELKCRLLDDFPENDPGLITDGVDTALMQLESADFIFAVTN